MQKDKENIILNSKTKDSGGKIIFDDNILCSQFLRDYIDMPFFLVSLIEHKTKIDYNVSMQIFRYMIYIWDAFEKEAERLHPGISKRADFCKKG